MTMQAKLLVFVASRGIHNDTLSCCMSGSPENNSNFLLTDLIDRNGLP